MTPENQKALEDVAKRVDDQKFGWAARQIWEALAAHRAQEGK